MNHETPEKHEILIGRWGIFFVYFGRLLVSSV